MVKISGVPWQVWLPCPVCGVTVIVAKSGLLLVFVFVKTGRLPLPLAAKPIAGLEFIQLNALAVPEKASIPDKTPLQATTSVTALMNGLGKTVIVVVEGVP